MELSEILDSLSSGSTEKTASFSAQNNSSLSSAIDRALNTGSTEKTASAHNAPAQDLIKIAQDISNAETDALVKEAHVYGTAVADGFAARMSQYSGGSPQAYGHSGETVKQAMELGYIHASNALVGTAQPAFSKTASYGNSPEMVKSAAYAQGQEDAVKTASFIKGQEDAVKTASFIKGQEDAVKTASFLKGQEDAMKTAASLTKIATDYANYGFKVGNSVLKRLR